MFRKALILGIILPLAVFFCKLALIGISNIKLGEFKPVVAIFLLDVSASNRTLLDAEKQCILRMAKLLITRLGLKNLSVLTALDELHTNSC